MELRLNLMYAKDLKRVNLVTKMKVYAVVSINGNASTNQKTPVDKENGTNPEWNCRMKFIIHEADVHQNLVFLVFALRTSRIFGDRDVGTVQVSVKELLDQTNGNHMAEHNVSYSVVLPEGKSRGILSFSYKFDGGSVPYPQIPWHDSRSGHEMQGGSPVFAFPSPQHGAPYPYPPPHGMGMFAYPQPFGGSYSPPAFGYYQQSPGPGSGYGYQHPSQGDGGRPPKHGRRGL